MLYTIASLLLILYRIARLSVKPAEPSVLQKSASDDVLEPTLTQMIQCSALCSCCFQGSNGPTRPGCEAPTLRN